MNLALGPPRSSPRRPLPESERLVLRDLSRSDRDPPVELFVAAPRAPARLWTVRVCIGGVRVARARHPDRNEAVRAATSKARRTHRDMQFTKGILVGLYAEYCVEKALEHAHDNATMPRWCYSFRRATVQEDREGVDFFVMTDILIGIQVKSSNKGLRSFERRRNKPPRTVCIVIDRQFPVEVLARRLFGLLGAYRASLL